MTMHPFTEKLLAWHRENPRALPWKNTKDPYVIWISEIILQQTRVAQGMPYYHRFIERFPDVHTLAKASEDEVLKYWEGLGYYSRARNLHFSAKIIVSEYNGKFPTDYNKILALKGIGPYTAAAIASFAFDLPHAVVDGNVIRVISRFFGISEPVDNSQVLKEIKTTTQDLLPVDNSAEFNQAIMDFGATHCTPDNPPCMFCTLSDICEGHQKGLVASIPRKSKKIKKRTRYFHFLIYRDQDYVWIRKRTEDIWKGLYEFPLVELSTDENPLDENTLHKVIQTSEWIKHILTHQLLKIRFYHLEGSPDVQNFSSLKKVHISDLQQFALPKPLQAYMKKLI